MNLLKIDTFGVEHFCLSDIEIHQDHLAVLLLYQRFGTAHYIEQFAVHHVAHWTFLWTQALVYHFVIFDIRQ